MEETKPAWRIRLSEARASIGAGAIIFLGFAGIAMSFATGTPKDIWKTGLYFAGALAVGFAALSVVAWLMLRLLKILSRRKLPSSVRHGIAQSLSSGARMRNPFWSPWESA